MLVTPILAVMQSTPDALARALKAARESRGMTQEDVAFQLRLLKAPRDSLATVGRWETGGSIKLEDAVLLASIYEMTLDELISAEGSDPGDPPTATRDSAEKAAARKAKPAARKPQPPSGRRPPSA